MCERLLARWPLRGLLLLALALPVSAAELSRSGTEQGLTVQHYDLDLSFDPAARTLSGTIEIAFRGLSSLRGQLTVDMAPTLAAHAVTLDGESVHFTHSGSSLLIALPAGSAVLRRHTLKIIYSGIPSHHLRFDTVAGQPAISSYGMPYSAMTWWPTFDEPALKAREGADITISAPQGDVAVSNGVLVGTQRLENGQTRYHWRESYPIYPDVISVAIGPYREISSTFHSITGQTIPLTFYIYPADLARVVPQLRTVPQILARYEALFGPYPFQRDKYGLAEITIPSFREHQTIPSIGRGLLLGTAPVWDLQDVQNVIAHDMAHQWFGDSVTPRRWADVWLNEGFATYAVALWQEKEGGPAALRRFMRSLDTGPFAGSVYVAPGAPRDELLTTTTFNEAAWVLHMLRHVMGDRAFFAALQTYARENRGGLVDTRTWIAACERQYGHPLGWFFREWLHAPGRPALHLAWRQDSGPAASLEITIRQTQTGPAFQLPVDLELITSGGSRVETVWMRRRAQRFMLPARGSVKKIVLDPDYWVLLQR